MIFSSLRTAAFRNLADTEVSTNAKNVFLVGDNGQGKTNFLEALYFCSYASSFRVTGDGDIARNGEKNFSVEVKILYSNNDNVLVKFEKNKKVIIINGKHAEDRKELLAVAPCIVFCHEDMEFTSGSPERRRWFFDQALSLYDPVYLEDLRRYRHVLKIRNTVLRDSTRRKPDGSIETVLDALDTQYAMYGKKLMEKRTVAVRDFSLVFGPLYNEVSGIDCIGVQYNQSWKTNLNKENQDIQMNTVQEKELPSEDEILSMLQNKRAVEMAAGLSISGPHRDRYIFTRNSDEFTGKASTGQRRLLALLLRAAQARRFSDMTGNKPVLLLDDVLLEMDGEKRRRFLSVLPEYDQAFFTFLPEEPYQRYCKDNTLVYTVKNGCLEISGV
ncbi:MAG: DNA replication and repair protein RecF [Treponema sp.]|jgi:DNA replication and repair protein RecF|nr:DNA replication and repair protein RecF [Treponema sp.]